MDILLALCAVVFGLVSLMWSADKFVEGATSAAYHLGMPALLIGMIIVGFGTSIPEILISAMSSWQGNPNIAIGNAYGSNITNISLILGVSALIYPIAISTQVLRREMPILLTITALAIALLIDGNLSRLDGAILILALGCTFSFSLWKERANKQNKNRDEENTISQEQILSVRKTLLWLIIGLVALFVSSRLLIWGTISITRYFGVSDLLISLTVVALGTSLPELASSIAAIRRGSSDLVIGNIVGSNLFNTLGVIGIASLVSPIPVERIVIIRDVPVMAFLTVSLFILSFNVFKKGSKIGRSKGAFLLICYLTYNGYLIYKAI